MDSGTGMNRPTQLPLPPKFEPWPDDHEPTPFQAAVVQFISRLEPGDLATYAEVAEAIGRPGAGQAVANVLRRAPDVPWWRVVPSDGRIYRSHRPVQISRLRAEGHQVEDDGHITPT
jgi:alkylated DNA nucleotide flippase Atl1